MRSLLRKLALGFALVTIYSVAQAQVKFKLTRTDDETYIVSMIPQQTVADRMAITGTMQVSMKMKATEGFELGGITSLQPEVVWDKGSMIKSPDGARDYDYLSVALQSMGTRGLDYQQGKEVPLFSFRNAGQSVSSIQLIDNEADPLVKAKVNRFNVQNHISVLGYGQKNAYAGNMADDSPATQKIGLRRLFPNPANNRVTVQWANYRQGEEGDVELAISESGTGRVVSREKTYMRAGSNETVIQVGQLPEGNYIINLEKAGLQLGAGLKLLITR